MEESKYSVSLERIMQDLELEAVFMPEGGEKILVSTEKLNRPGMQMAGFYDYYDNRRIQIIGRLESTYLSKLDSKTQEINLRQWFELGMPAIVLARGIKTPPIINPLLREFGIPLLRTGETPSSFYSTLISYLSVALAPRVTLHGVLLEVFGVGVLLQGESGIGKSETALGLIQRRHRLIADDAVEIKRVTAGDLMGNAPEVIRNFMEIRGIGIIDIKNIFGIAAVETTHSVDLVINLELWKQDKNYDRLGLEYEYENILDVEVPCLTLPVRPGRDLAAIIEIACMDNRLKMRGHNAASDLNRRLEEEMYRQEEEDV